MFIRYIGKAPFHTDNLFGTGTAWNGPGAIAEVADATGRMMVANHPDVYQKANSLDDTLPPVEPSGSEPAGGESPQAPTVRYADLQLPEQDGSSSPLATASLAALRQWFADNKPFVRITEGQTEDQLREAITRLVS